MSWWYDSDWYYDWESEESKQENEDQNQEKSCKHSWKPIKLVVSIVFDCEKCGMKKEEFDS